MHDEDVKEVNESLKRIDVTLAKQAVQIEYHIRRTDILEDAIKPLQVQKAQIDGVLKALGLVSALGGAVFTALEVLWPYLRKLL